MKSFRAINWNFEILILDNKSPMWNRLIHFYVPRGWTAEETKKGGRREDKTAAVFFFASRPEVARASEGGWKAFSYFVPLEGME